MNLKSGLFPVKKEEEILNLKSGLVPVKKERNIPNLKSGLNTDSSEEREEI